MAKRTKKQFRSNLKLEALEQRQLLAGVSGAGTELTPGGADTSTAQHFITAPNGNHYDQVLMQGTSVTVSNDPGQITRVSFLDLQGDIVQAEFSGAGTLTVSMDTSGGNLTKSGVQPQNYNQNLTGTSPGGQAYSGYEQGLASFSVQGSDSTTNLLVFSVGKATATNQALFDATHNGGNGTADVQRITIVANPANPNGSVFGSIFAGNAIFTDNNGVAGGVGGVVGITASNIQIQNTVTVGDIVASGSATPSLVFGQQSQFGQLTVAGGGLLSPNGKAINNTNSYAFTLAETTGAKSDGTVLAAQNTLSQLQFTGPSPVNAQNRTFTLTPNPDTFVGGTGTNVFNATDTTFTAFDNIKGNGGSDTLNLVNATGTMPNGAIASVTNVPNVNLSNQTGNVTSDLSGWTGLKNLTVTENAVAGVVAVTTGGTATNVTLAGAAGAVTITDSSSAPTLTTVTDSGNSGLLTITNGGALTTVNLTNTAGGLTVTKGNTGSLTLTLNNVTGGTITDSNNTSLTLTNSVADATLAALNVSAATSVTLDNGGKKLTLTADDFSKATTLTIKGSGATTLNGTDATKLAALTTIDLSGSTGAVSIAAQLPVGVTITPGTGADTITVGAVTKTITLGAANDTVTVLGGAVGIGGTINGGGGTNTLSMTAGDATTAQSSVLFGQGVSNFQALTITGGAQTTLDMSKLLNINSVQVSGATATDALTLNKFGANGTLTINQAATGTAAGAAYTVVLADATGTADVLNVALKTAAGANATSNYGTVNAPGIESIVLTASQKGNGATDVATQQTVSLADTSLTSLKLSGTAGITLTTNSTAITSVDTTGIAALTGTPTQGLVWTTNPALTAASTINTGPGADTITLSASVGVVSLNSGDGNDAITIVNANANIIKTGAGNSTVTVGSGNNTITVGDGVNTVIATSGNNTITMGKGGDTLTVTTGNNTIVSGVGTDTITVGSGFNTITGGGGNDTFKIAAGADINHYTTITDAQSGNKITFTGGVGTEVFTGGTAALAKVALAPTSSFQNFLDAASTGDGSLAGKVSWFQFGGNTYVVNDVSAGGTFVPGTDTVIGLTGLVNLASGPSTVTGAGNAATLTII